METDKTITEEQLQRARTCFVGFRRQTDFLEEPLQGELLFGDVRDSDLGTVPHSERKDVHYILVGHFRGPQKYSYPGHDIALKLGGIKHAEYDGFNIALKLNFCTLRVKC